MQKASAFTAAALFAGLAAVAAPSAANARIIFETAAFTGVDTGEYIVYDTRYIGAVFTLSKTTQITGIGGQFGGYPAGTIFGAIIPISSGTGLPDLSPSMIEADSKGHVKFAAPSATTDLTEPLDVTLSAGSYAVVFGAGAFGADGSGGLGDGNTTIGSPGFVQYASWNGDAWTSESFDGVRITVSAVPELSTWAMLTIGFVGLGFAASRNGIRGSRALG
jgi:hypothetical protein